MPNLFRRATLALFACLVSLAAAAQPGPADEKPEMAELMRSNGKIYVVVGVILIILAGLFLYLISLDRKIGKIEHPDQ